MSSRNAECQCADSPQRVVATTRTESVSSARSTSVIVESAAKTSSEIGLSTLAGLHGEIDRSMCRGASRDNKDQVRAQEQTRQR